MDSCKFCPQCEYRFAATGGGVCAQCIADNESRARFSEDAEDLARFRAMFPVPPWSTDDITGETCESLGMHRSDDGYSFSIPDYLYVYQMMDDSWQVTFCGRSEKGMKSGCLAMLVAARRSAK